jgi:hypothetical protein
LEYSPYVVRIDVVLKSGAKIKRAGEEGACWAEFLIEECLTA